MNREELMDFLNDDQQKFLADYILLGNSLSKKPVLRKGDSVRIMYKYNYQLNNGGTVVEVTKWPIIKIKVYGEKSFYELDVNRVYLFYRRGKTLTKRDYYEDLLENLENLKLKKSK